MFNCNFCPRQWTCQALASGTAMCPVITERKYAEDLEELKRYIDRGFKEMYVSMEKAIERAKDPTAKVYWHNTDSVQYNIENKDDKK